MKNLEDCVERGRNRLLLTKAKLQQLGVSSSTLTKLKPVSQGTQAGVNEPSESDAQIVEKPQRDIITIPNDETDKAIRGNACI